MLYEKQAKYKSLSSDASANINKAIQANNTLLEVKKGKRQAINDAINIPLNMVKQTSEINNSNLFNENLRKTYETFKDSGPKVLSEELDKVKNNFMISSMDYNYKVNIYKNFLQKKNSYVLDAENREYDRINKNNKTELENQFASTSQDRRLMYKNVFNGTPDVDGLMNLKEEEERDLLAIQTATTANNYNINQNSINDPLFNIEQRTNEYKKNASNDKILTGKDWYEEIFDTDKTRASQLYKQWEMNPDYIKKSCGLSDNEYHEIFNHMRKIYGGYESQLKDVDKNYKEWKKEQKEKLASLRNDAIMDLDQRFVTLKDNNSFFQENIQNGSDYLITTKELMEQYKNVLTPAQYKNYNKKVGDYAFKYIQNIDDANENTWGFKKGWFRDTSLRDGLQELKNLPTALPENEYGVIAMDFLVKMRENNIPLDSYDTKNKNSAKKIAQEVVFDYYNIPDEERNIRDIVKTKKKEKDKQVVDDIFNSLI